MRLHNVLYPFLLNGALLSGGCGPAKVDEATPKCDPTLPDNCPCRLEGASAKVPAAGPDAALEPIDFSHRTKWLPPDERKKGVDLEARYTNQDGGTGKLQDLVNRPTALTFFYTRCENPHKCAAAVCAMGQLQRALEAARIDHKVRLLLISYEPEHDTPALLRAYGSSRDVRTGANAQLLRLNAPLTLPSPPEEGGEGRVRGAAQPVLLAGLDVPVNYNAGWVNVHGMALFLLDGRGRLVRKYHTVVWDNLQVLEDLTKLATEAPPE